MPSLWTTGFLSFLCKSLYYAICRMIVMPNEDIEMIFHFAKSRISKWSLLSYEKIE